MVRVELEDVVVCVGGWVDIDCEEIFKVLPVQALFQNFFSKAELCVCVCVCVILFQKYRVVVLLFRFGRARESAIEKNNRTASIPSSTCYNGC